MNFNMIIEEFTKEGFLSFLSTVMIICLPINFSTNKKSKGNILGSSITFIIILLVVAKAKDVNVFSNLGIVIGELGKSIGLVFEGILNIISNNVTR